MKVVLRNYSYTFSLIGSKVNAVALKKAGKGLDICMKVWYTDKKSKNMFEGGSHQNGRRQ